MAESERKRGRPRREGARADIVRATLETIAECGFAATTVDSIAARAGIGRATIYRRWSSKEELFVEAVNELTTVEEFAAAGPFSPDGSPASVKNWLLKQAEAIRDSLSDPTVSKVIPALVGELPINPQLAAVWEERVVRPRQDALRRHLAAAVAVGSLRPAADPDAIADLLLGPFYLHVVSPFGHPDPGSDYAMRLVEVIWAGVAPAE